MLRVTKTFEFHAAHSLPDYEGACANLHGHTYVLEVALQGPVGEDGFVVDFGVMKSRIEMKVIDHLDHRFLNEILPNPTAENLVLWIVGKITELYPGKTPEEIELVEVRLWETARASAQWLKTSTLK